MVSATATAVVLILAGGCGAGGEERGTAPDTAQQLQLVEGGTFEMGDVFEEGVPLATPVHEVTVSSFYLSRYEVTVGEFRAFIEQSGYVTSAEQGEDCAARAGKVPAPRTQEEYAARLASCGALILDPVAGETSWGLNACWRNPLFEQSPKDPVTCVSWTDAVSYCNWLSVQVGLPPAYDVNTGDLLDAKGRATTDVTQVKGYRLPTEAEWSTRRGSGGGRSGSAMGKIWRALRRSTSTRPRGSMSLARGASAGRGPCRWAASSPIAWDSTI